MKKLIAVLGLFTALAGCGAAPDKSLPLAQYAKELAGDGAVIHLTEQITPKTYLVEVALKGPDMFLGGAQDWNSFSAKVQYIAEPLLERNDVARVRIESDVTASNGQPMGWAYADVDKKKMPANFHDLTYLEFASVAHLDAGTLQAGGWLCEFYKKYESAQPHGKLPSGC